MSARFWLVRAGSALFSLTLPLSVATAQAEPAAEPRGGGLWARGALELAYLGGTYVQRDRGSSGDVRKYESALDGPGLLIFGALGYRTAGGLGAGAYADAGVFGGGVRMHLTTASEPYVASTGGVLSLQIAEELFTSATFGLCQLGWLSGSRAALAGEPPAPSRLRGPTASLELSWFRGSLGLQGRVAYLRVSRDDAELRAVMVGLAIAAQYW